MNIPPKGKPEMDSIKNAFITTSVALYLQSCHLQYEEADAVMLSFLIANASSSQSGNNAGKGTNAGNTGQGNKGDDGDDDDTDHNLGSSLVNNTGQVTSDSEFIDAGKIDVTRQNSESSSESADESEEENIATTSPGGSGDSRIIGGVKSEDDAIDWTDTLDEGTKDADAATG
jgi:hypothetical protein